MSIASTLSTSKHFVCANCTNMFCRTFFPGKRIQLSGIYTQYRLKSSEFYESAEIDKTVFCFFSETSIVGREFS